MFGIRSDSFVYTTQKWAKSKGKDTNFHLNGEDLRQFFPCASNNNEEPSLETNNESKIDEGLPIHSLRKKISNGIHSISIRKGKHFGSYTEVAFNGKVLRVHLSRYQPNPNKKKRGRPKIIKIEPTENGYDTENMGSDTDTTKKIEKVGDDGIQEIKHTPRPRGRPRKEGTSVNKENIEKSAKRGRGRPRKILNNESQNKTPRPRGRPRTTKINNKRSISESSEESEEEVLVTERIVKRNNNEQINKFLPDTNEDLLDQLTTSPKRKRIKLIEMEKPIPTDKITGHRRYHSESMMKKKINFSQLLLDLKNIVLPSKDWEVHCAFASRSHVCAVYLKCKRDDNVKSIKINNALRYFLSINAVNVVLLGAPKKVQSFYEISVLADIIHNMNIHDPLLLYSN